jgi:hypothetical protein
MKLLKILLISIPLTLVYTPPINAQGSPTDTLIYVGEISANSVLEGVTLNAYFNNHGQDNFALFSAINDQTDQSVLATHRSSYESLLKKVAGLNLLKKSPEKKVKAIYKVVHNEILTKYELENNFSEVFNTGTYNCVSATALYSLIFDNFDIPYTIKETPTHVYIVAYPNSNRIKVETTDPSSGFYVFQSAFKKQYIDQLKKMKLISEQEFKESSVDVLFDKYYFTEEDISIEELVGIQYVNDAIYLIDKTKYQEAYVQLEKGYLFYPSAKTKYLLLSMCADILSKSDYTDINDISYLVKFSRMKEFDVSNDVIIGEWARATNSVLIDKGQPTHYNQMYDSLILGIQDSLLKNEISYYYNYEQGRVLYNKGKYVQSLPHIEKAYNIKPKNHDAEQLLVANIANTLRSADTKKAITILEDQSTRHERLNNNDIFNNMLIRGYLQEVIENFSLGKIKEGLKYKTLFETRYENLENKNLDAYAIGRAYSLIAVHYYKKGYTSKAKTVINQGLVYSPNNFELLSRKKMIR